MHTATGSDSRRRAVVTGGGSGIGKAIAHRLAAEGIAVTIVGRRGERLVAAVDEINVAVGAGRADHLIADLTDVDAVDDLRDAVGRTGPVDYLVNNAGGFCGTADDGTLEGVARRFRADFDGNALSTILTTEALLPQLSTPGGRIVMISSIAGLRGAGSYGTAKAAVHGYAWGLADRLAPRGVTVNVVAPGHVVGTDFWTSRTGDTTEGGDRSAAVSAPLGRAGRPEEIAECVAYLLCDRAGWTTGQIFQVNGGMLLGHG